MEMGEDHLIQTSSSAFQQARQQDDLVSGNAVLMIEKFPLVGKLRGLIFPEP